MYQVLYRKYRPQSFKDIVGQKFVVKTLHNAIVNDKLSHAYLLTGARGTGKTSIAKILAKTINCQNIVDGCACNKCVFCTQTKNMDIIEIDAASNNGINEIRELKSKINLVPSIGKYKVYIIDEVHMLTTEAFNALLKTLEEPPDFVIFILATTEPHKLPSTILSRCQRFDLKRLTTKQIFDRITDIAKKEKIKLTSDAALEIAKLSSGGLRDAIGMLDQASSLGDGNIDIDIIYDIFGVINFDSIGKIIENVYKKSISYLLTQIEFYDNNGKDFGKIVEQILIYVKEIMTYKIDSKIIMEEEVQKTYDIVKDITLEELLNFSEILCNTLNEIKKEDNARLVFELMLIKMCSVNIGSINNRNIKSKKLMPLIIEPVLGEHQDQCNIKKEKGNLLDEINRVKKIRINNTLAGFDKKKLGIAKEKIAMVRDLSINTKYSKSVSLLLDGRLKAIGNNTLIFVYDNKKLSNYFNTNLLLIEEAIMISTKEEYKVISTDSSDWEEIRKKFNSKTEKYNFIEETFDLEKLNKLENEYDLNDLFGDIVEYN